MAFIRGHVRRQHCAIGLGVGIGIGIGIEKSMICLSV